MKSRAYIDIETTGLSISYADLTVIGVGIEQGDKIQIVQLVEHELSEIELLAALAGTDELYSYNGSRFDLPFIRAKLGVDLRACFKHTDLMYACWRNNLMGGLKVVERRLGIERKLQGIDGRAAVRLWYQYVNNCDTEALQTLLYYNREDVLNLQLLRKILGVK